MHYRDRLQRKCSCGDQSCSVKTSTTERLLIQGSMDSANIQKTWWLYKLYIGDYITHLAPRGLTSLPWWLLFCCSCWWKLQGGCAYGNWCDGCGVNTDKFRSKFKQGNPKTVTIMTRAFADTSEGPHLPKGFQARVRDKGRIRTRRLQAHSPKPIRSWCRLWIRGVVRNLLPRENLKKMFLHQKQSLSFVFTGGGCTPGDPETLDDINSFLLLLLKMWQLGPWLSILYYVWCGGDPDAVHRYR